MRFGAPVEILFALAASRQRPTLSQMLAATEALVYDDRSS